MNEEERDESKHGKYRSTAAGTPSPVDSHSVHDKTGYWNSRVHLGHNSHRLFSDKLIQVLSSLCALQSFYS